MLATEPSASCQLAAAATQLIVAVKTTGRAVICCWPARAHSCAFCDPKLSEAFGCHVRSLGWQLRGCVELSKCTEAPLKSCGASFLDSAAVDSALASAASSV